MAKVNLTAERLRELVAYDPETGLFTSLVQRSRCAVGDPVGTLAPHGYMHARIDGQKHYMHRLAWLYVHGEVPADGIDHANRDRSDNRIANLRPASQEQNLRNRFGRARSGFKGVSPTAKGGMYRARIFKDKRERSLGWFPTAEQAARAYDAAAILLFGEFACLNFPRDDGTRP